MVACDGRFELSEKNEGRVPKYTDVFKTQLVAESRAVGATAPMISKRHNVPVNRIGSVAKFGFSLSEVKNVAVKRRILALHCRFKLKSKQPKPH